jgi:hypothetical protein
MHVQPETDPFRIAHLLIAEEMQPRSSPLAAVVRPAAGGGSRSSLRTNTNPDARLTGICANLSNEGERAGWPLPVP